MNADDLAAYVDDQLDPYRRVAVEAFLARNPTLAAEVMADLHIRDELRLALTEPQGTPATTEAARKLSRALFRDRLLRHATRIAAAITVAGVAWLSYAGLSPFSVSKGAASAPPPAYVTGAVAAHEASLLRLAMISQPEVTQFDAAEIRALTGITLPTLPDDWQVQDVQLFPSPDGPAVAMVLDTPDHGAIWLFTVRPGGTLTTPPAAEQRPDMTLGWYRMGEVAHVLIAHTDADTLTHTARDLIRAAR